MCQYFGKLSASTANGFVKLSKLYLCASRFVNLFLNLSFSCCISALPVNAVSFELPFTAACIFMNARFVSFQFHIQTFGALKYSFASHRKDKLPRFSSSSYRTTFLWLAMKLVISSHISQNLGSASRSK